MNITREQLLEFLNSEGVQASYILGEDYNIAVDAFFERLAQESGWQPIETAPKDGSKILVWDGENQYVARYATYADTWSIPIDSESYAIDSCYGGDVSYAELSPTHWMRLPGPPKNL